MRSMCVRASSLPCLKLRRPPFGIPAPARGLTVPCHVPWDGTPVVYGFITRSLNREYCSFTVRYKNVALGLHLQPKVNVICVKIEWATKPHTVPASLPFIGLLKPVQEGEER